MKNIPKGIFKYKPRTVVLREFECRCGRTYAEGGYSWESTMSVISVTLDCEGCDREEIYRGKTFETLTLTSSFPSEYRRQAKKTQTMLEAIGLNVLDEPKQKQKKRKRVRGE